MTSKIPTATSTIIPPRYCRRCNYDLRASPVPRRLPLSWFVLLVQLVMAMGLVGCAEHGFDAPRFTGLGSPVPLVFPHKWACPRVVGTVNGVTGTFLLDTGAMTSSFSSDFCRRAHLVDEPHMTASGPASDGSIRRSPMVWVSEIRLGQASIQEFLAVREELNPALHVDGALGVPQLFGGPPLTINAREGYLVWGRPPMGTPLPLGVTGSPSHIVQISARGTFANDMRVYILDTGSTFAYLGRAGYTGPVRQVEKPLHVLRAQDTKSVQNVSYVAADDFSIEGHPNGRGILHTRRESPANRGTESNARNRKFANIPVCYGRH